MGSPNISVVAATVNGANVGFSGGGTSSVDTWTLNNTIDIFDFNGPIEITLNFDDLPLNGGSSTGAPFAISSVGNLGTVFSNYTLTIDATGLVTLTVERTDFIQAGTVSFVVDGGGDPGGDTVYISFICFAQGTLIETPAGPIAVEALSKGDQVTTLASGPKALRWVGSRTLDRSSLNSNQHLRPITIEASAFGPNNPSADLTVSPQHRILVNTPSLELNFWLEMALAPAKGLVDNDKVKVSAQESVTYYHLLFHRHEIICSNGTWTESLFPGQQSMLALDDAARREVLELFPELASETYPEPAAPFLTVREARVLAGQKIQQFERAV